MPSLGPRLLYNIDTVSFAYSHIYPGVFRSCILFLMPLLGLTVDYVRVYKELLVLILSMPSIDGYGPRAQLLMDLIVFFKEWRGV